MGADFDGIDGDEQDNGWLLKLSEFGEVPKNYVSVYLVVSQGQAEAIARNGVLPYTPWHNDQELIDEEIDEMLEERKIPVRRKGSFFAYSENPNTPRMALRTLPIKKDDVILEIKVDPQKCFVAYAEVYDNPRKYVESVVSYNDFMSREDYENSGFWEVIVPVEGSVPRSLVKVTEVVKEVKNFD